MTNSEMTEIFTVLKINYRYDKMFRDGETDTLLPTIKLWTTALADVDFWTGQQALIVVLRECRYPPTIAEFHEAAERVTQELNRQASDVFTDIRTGELLHGTLEAYYATLLPGNKVKAVIDRMGGTQNLVREVMDGYAWNLEAILATAKEVIKDRKKLLAGGKPALLSEKGNTNE